MSDLLIATVAAVRYLTLNRPEKRNALNDELITELKAALTDAGTDESLCAIVIQGAGNDFCSGADLESIRRLANATYEDNLDDARRLMELFTQIRNTPIPVIAAVRGRALAGGAGLATACDIVLAARSARFGYPEVKLGFVPAMVMAILRRNIGEKLAFEMVTMGFEFTVERASEIGLVNHILDDSAFESEVADFANVYATVSRSAVVMTKRLLYRMDDLDFNEAILAGAEVNAEARMSEDCRRGIARFLKKDLTPR
jgi:methylglutaconyl-CoA hydratase